MRIEIDTTEKSIKMLENIKLDELMELAQRLYPNDWREFKLIPHTEIRRDWTQPYITPAPYYEEHPWITSPNTYPSTNPYYENPTTTDGGSWDNITYTGSNGFIGGSGVLN
jgi:hypothetical protein